MVTQVLFDGGSTNHITILSFLPKLVLVDGPVIVRPVVVVVTVDEGEDLGAVMGATVVVTGSILANSTSSLM